MSIAQTDSESPARKVAAALATLTPEHREIIRLAHYRGLPVRELAVRLELSETMVRRRILFALRALKLSLDELDSAAGPDRSAQRT